MTLNSRLRGARRFLTSLVREFNDTGCTDSTASLTYTTLFALVPMMTVAFALLKVTPQLHAVGDRIEALIFENFLPASGDQLRHYLTGFSAQASRLTGIGVLFLLTTSLFMLLTVERAFNRIWRVHRQRRLLPSLLVYWALLTLGPLLVGSGFVASSWLAAYAGRETMAGVEHLPVWEPLLAMLPFLLGAVFLSLLYIAVPNCDVPVREGIVGGIVASLLMEVARHAFTLVVLRFTAYELVYGAFAVVPLFLAWIYISWAITLFGVVLVYVLANRDDTDVPPATTFPALLKVLAMFREHQQKGLPVPDQEARHVARRAGIDNWHEFRERLLARRILERDERGALLLVRDLHTLRLADVARVMNWEAVSRAARGREEPDAFARDMAGRLREAMADFDARLDESVASALDREAAMLAARQ